MKKHKHKCVVCGIDLAEKGIYDNLGVYEQYTNNKSEISYCINEYKRQEEGALGFVHCCNCNSSLGRIDNFEKLYNTILIPF